MNANGVGGETFEEGGHENKLYGVMTGEYVDGKNDDLTSLVLCFCILSHLGLHLDQFTAYSLSSSYHDFNYHDTRTFRSRY